nr:38K [Neodiprion sertifer nucleopolyhedrovirus]
MEAWLCIDNRNSQYDDNVLFITSESPLAKSYSFYVKNYIKYIVVKLYSHISERVIINYLCETWNLTKIVYIKFETSDDMRSIRKFLNNELLSTKLGPAFVLREDLSLTNVKALLEWGKYDLSDVSLITEYGLYSPVRHVIVFDLDNTLITDSIPAELRCHYVPHSLAKLHEDHILVLWSYGNVEHVRKSLIEINLPQNIFTCIICGGRSAKTDNIDETKRIFVVENNIRDVANLPKSVTVVTQYLNAESIYYFKSFTLIDDKKSNQINYDYFIQCKRAKKPMNDWRMYHEVIVKNIQHFDSIMD